MEAAGPIEQTVLALMTPGKEVDEPRRKVLLRVSERILTYLEDLTVQGETSIPSPGRDALLLWAKECGEPEEALNPRQHHFRYVAPAVKYVFLIQGKLLELPPDLLIAEEARAEGWNI